MVRREREGSLGTPLVSDAPPTLLTLSPRRRVHLGDPQLH